MSNVQHNGFVSSTNVIYYALSNSTVSLVKEYCPSSKTYPRLSSATVNCLVLSRDNVHCPALLFPLNQYCHLTNTTVNCLEITDNYTSLLFTVQPYRPLTTLSITFVHYPCVMFPIASTTSHCPPSLSTVQHY